MRELQLWLETAPGCRGVPSDFYAGIRNVKNEKNPGQCSPFGNEGVCLGNVHTGEGTVEIDIFQRVGSLSVNLQDPGIYSDATILLNDGEPLRLRAYYVPHDAVTP